MRTGVGMHNAIVGKVIFLCLCQGTCEGPLLENTALNKRWTGKLETSKMSQSSQDDMSGKGCKFTAQDSFHHPQITAEMHSHCHSHTVNSWVSQSCQQSFFTSIMPTVLENKAIFRKKHPWQVKGNWGFWKEKNAAPTPSLLVVVLAVMLKGWSHVSTASQIWDTKLCALHFSH